GDMTGSQTVSIVDVAQKSGEGRKGPWTNYRFKLNDGTVEYWASTFDTEIGDRLSDLAGTGVSVTLELGVDGSFTNIIDVLDWGASGSAESSGNEIPI
ncbi:MAG: hypothetical protein MJH10_19540, partial [Epibacterium sp.]|nr:hypothetical protein [Epibacterium sp.]NQX75678.1 hypothetical protein [Epibacterium sp.]